MARCRNVKLQSLNTSIGLAMEFLHTVLCCIVDRPHPLSPDRCQATFWTKAGILLIEPLGTNFSEILIKIQKTFHSWRCIWKCRLGNDGGHFVPGRWVNVLFCFTCTLFSNSAIACQYTSLPYCSFEYMWAKYNCFLLCGGCSFIYSFFFWLFFLFEVICIGFPW